MSEAEGCYSAGERLEKFGYPDALREVVLRFVQLVHSHFLDFDSGVLLVGSAARGELSWIIEQNRIELFSDIEFLVGVKNKNRSTEEQFKKAVFDLENDYEFGPSFHIDYTLIPWHKFRRIDKKFFVFESKHCGIEFGHRAVRCELPPVTRSNLNWKELNEVLLHRMNSMLSSVPLVLLKNPKASVRPFVLSLAKNTLDVTTWLHPYESVELTAGFERRLQDWEENVSARLLGKYLSDNEIRHIRLCLTLRKKPRTEVSVLAMLGNTLLVYQRAISYCKAMNGIEQQVSISAVCASRKLFEEYRFRARLRSAVSILRHFRYFGLVNASRNMVTARKGIQANFGFHMLCAVSEYLQKDEHCWDSLTAARLELKRLLPDMDNLLEDFADSWGNVRAHYKEYCRALG